MSSLENCQLENTVISNSTSPDEYVVDFASYDPERAERLNANWAYFERGEQQVIRERPDLMERMQINLRRLAEHARQRWSAELYRQQWTPPPVPQRNYEDRHDTWVEAELYPALDNNPRVRSVHPYSSPKIKSVKKKEDNSYGSLALSLKNTQKLLCV
jgi:hypothetical protein